MMLMITSASFVLSRLTCLAIMLSSLSISVAYQASTSIINNSNNARKTCSSSSSSSLASPVRRDFELYAELDKETLGTKRKKRKSSSTYYNAADYYTYDDSLYTQAVCDVDDTLKSSGGVHVAGVALGGIDVQYARGQVYPGVSEFMLQICQGPRTGKQSIPPKLAILTARAEEFKQYLQLKEDSPVVVAAKQTSEQNKFISKKQYEWGIGPVLYGSVAEWIFQYRKGLRKFNNMERLLQQDPSGGRIMSYVYIGDTGEYDQQAGEAMLREYPNVIKAVFLHVVSNKPSQRNIQVPGPKLINGRPMVFFRTYVGAALGAAQLDLMSNEGLERVITAAVDALQKTPRDSSKWADLDRDLEAAYDYLDR